MRESLAAWHLRVPRLRTASDDLRHSFAQSVADLAALRHAHRRRDRDAARRRDALVHDRLRPRHADHVPADDAARPRAGDRLARGARLAPGARGRCVDRRRAGQDRARAAARAGGRDVVRAYYGTVDATPLFLVLLSEVWRWTADAALVERLRAPALAALELDRPVRRPRRRRLRRVRAADAARAREPVWKDSGDSQRFHDGAFARAADRAGRGAGLRLRREAAAGRAGALRLGRRGARRAARARGGGAAGRASTSASGSTSAAATTRSRSTRDKRPVDSLCSNLGHLLWSGIVPPERVETIAPG